MKETIAGDVALIKKSEAYPVTTVVLTGMTNEDMNEYETAFRREFPGRLFVLVSCPLDTLNQLKIKTIF